MRRFLLCALTASVLVSGPAGAQQPGAARPPALVRLVDCRGITDTTARLACYDREVAALDAAEARKDLVVVDREQLSKTRRTLFGLTLPNLSVFGDDSPDAEAFAKLDTKIKTARQNPYGKWTFVLEDGATWSQVDSRNLGVDPRPGDDISIRRAAMGSYLANVNKQIAIRVQRLR